MNNLKTIGLLGFMSVLLVLVAEALGYSLWLGLGFAAFMNFIAYFFSAKIALASSRARPVTEQELPQVYTMVQNLCSMNDMPEPKIYLIDSPQPNAFATGRNPKHAAVAVTTGILQVLDYEELEGVIGHELSHVKNRDILIGTVAATLAAALTVFARLAFWGGGRRSGRDSGPLAIVALIALILAPFAAMLLRLAVSRAREYQADATGADLTGKPLKLADALAKIGASAAQIPMEVNPAVAPLYIENPRKAFAGKDTFGRLFSTHPPMSERVARLRAMAYPS